MGAEPINEPGGPQGQPPTQTPASTGQAGSGQQGAGGSQSEAARLESLERELAALKTQAHSGSQTLVQDRLDAPGATADEVRRQLEARDRERQAAADREGITGQIADLTQQIKDLKEQPPEPPVRRVERVMGWRKA